MASYPVHGHGASCCHRTETHLLNVCFSLIEESMKDNTSCRDEKAENAKVFGTPPRRNGKSGTRSQRPTLNSFPRNRCFWTRFRFWSAAGQCYPQQVSHRTGAFSAFSSPPLKSDPQAINETAESNDNQFRNLSFTSRTTNCQIFCFTANSSASTQIECPLSDRVIL